MTNNLENEIRAIVVGMDNQESQENQQPQQDIQDMYVFIVRETDGVAEDQSAVIDSTPATVTTQQDSNLSAYMFVCFSLSLILVTLTFQLYSLFNPPIATVTIIPKSQHVTLSGTVQLGRLIRPITISQSATTQTTGKGHQDARAATGYLTFYNGQFQSVTISAGTLFQGTSGIQIVTDQDATLPAGNPPSYGQVTVSAHAISPGSKGNIPSFDINQIYANAVLVKNTNSFYGGVDQRDFSTVSAQDMNKLSTPLKISLAQSMQGALQGQLQTNEQLQILPCSPTISPNHNVGDEAIQVKVTVSETCSAAAYNSQSLEEKATALLTTQALKKLPIGYSLFGTAKVSDIQASVTSTSPP